MKSQSDFSFSSEQLQTMRDDIKAYFLDELEIEIGDLQADFFIDFLNTKVAKYYYNQGIIDSMSVMKEKVDDLSLLVKE